MHDRYSSGPHAGQVPDIPPKITATSLYHPNRKSGRHPLPVLAARILFLFFLIVGLAFSATSSANAQNVDWLVNNNDIGSDPTPAAGTIVYNVRVDNNGFDPAPATTIDLAVPANTVLTGTSGAITGCNVVPTVGPGVVTCNVPPLASLGSADLTVDILTTQQGTVTFTASVPTAGDIDPLNNVLPEITTVIAGADMGLQVNGPTSAAAGSVVTYTFVATNNGPDPITSAELQVPVPTGLVNISAPAGCTLGAGVYNCSIATTVAPGASVNRVFTGQISAASGSDITPLGSVVNVTPTDAQQLNNSDTITTAVTAGSDVRIVKTRSPGGALLTGDAVTFTLAASYTGDSPTGLSILDTVPSNYTINSVSPSAGWSCTVNLQDVACSRATGGSAGAAVSLGSVTINTTAATSGITTNTATISASGPVDPNPTNNVDDDGGAVISDPVVDLRANKSGPNPPLLAVGNTYNFPVSVTNVGNAAFYGTLVLTDTIPSALNVTGYSLNGWTCTPAATVVGPATVTCQRVYTAGSPLAPGATTPPATLQTVATAAGSLTNTVNVSSPDANIADGNGANDSASYTVTSSVLTNVADISVLKTASVPTVIAGQVQTFDLEIVNAGPQPSVGVTLTDNLTGLINNAVGASGAGLVSTAVSAGSASGVSCSTASSGGTSRRLTCGIASLPVCVAGSGDCPVITVSVRPGGNGGSRTNSAQAISGTTADPNLANNAGTASFTVDPRADVTITKVASPSPAVAGQNVTYVLTARNLPNGLSQAQNVVITDSLPANVTFVSASPSAGSCATTPAANSTTGPGNDQVVCNLGTINNGAQRTLTILVRPNTVTQGTTLVNTAAVTTTTIETDSTNNTASASTPIIAPVLDLLVNKTDSVDPVAVDDTTVYTISVRNLGPSAAENVVVTDTLPPAGLSYQSHTTDAGGSCSTVPPVNSVGGTLVCGFPLLLPGDVFTINVTARGVSKGSFVNDVSISSTEIALGFDTNSTNNSTTENTTVRTRADLEVVSKVATPNPVNLLDNFDFVITVRNNTGAGLAEADNVVVSDNLPSNMVLTGTPTVAVLSGSATASSCTGSAGAGSFSCDLGTFSNGGVATITAPVEVTSVTALPQSVTNSASISTSSLDPVSGNNSGSGSVSVGSSSIAGNVFRDFANDAAFNASDTGVGGVTLTLTGTSFDGRTITRTSNSQSGGDYIFRFLPAGAYTVTRGTVAENHLVNGTNSAGSAGGTVASPTVISAINLPANTAATGYLFPLVPTARIGIAKAVQSGPTANADGSFNVTYRLRVENFSLEPLSGVTVSDVLAGGAPAHGTYVALATPATDPMARGSYTVLSAPTGSCGGLNAGFDGNTAQTVAGGFGLGAAATCTIDVAVRVQPTVPFPPVQASGGRYENQASVTGNGTLSGQTSGTNPQLADISDNGSNPDPNGNGVANEATENDPTPVAPSYGPSIALVKAANTAALSSPPVANETITYNFTVTNTGDVTLTNIGLTEALAGATVSGGPIASLAPGASDTTTFSATYDITQADVDAGSVQNQATVTGTDPFDNPTSDLSGATNADDLPLVTSLTAGPAITLVKSATTAFATPPAVGDTISYTFTVANTGNVTLSNVTLSDILPGIVVSGGPIASMAPGDTDGATFTASYALTQADIDAGQVTNQATATGTPPVGAPVSDLSGSAADNDTPTVTAVGQSPGIVLVKTADDTDFLDGPDPTDRVRYSFAITNTGNVTLTNVVVTDPLPGIAISGGPIASLAPGATDSSTYTATYAPTAADFTAGQVNNTATATGDYGPGGASSISTTGSASAVVVAIEANPEPFPPFATDGGTTTSVLASDRERGGPATLANVTITVLAEDPGVTLDPGTGLITLAPGNPAGNYNVTYQICSVLNPTVCAQTTETVNQLPIDRIETTKTQTLVDNGDGIDGVGDRIDYVITVANLGNTAITNVALSDTLTSLASNGLALDSGPAFVSSSLGSPEFDLQIGETATYSASYTFTISSVTDGGISNTATASALPVYGAGVIGTPAAINDVSDDGDDTDGNTTDDPTVYPIASSLAPTGLTVSKTTTSGVVQRGGIVPYTITVRNDNPVVSGSLNIVDVLPQGFLYEPGSAMLDGAPYTVRAAGQVVTWPNVPVPPLTTVTATLSARVTSGANPGSKVNVASIRNPATNGLLAARATATVRILPEPAFDCGDVVGKVFDDRNQDGHQTPPGPQPIIDDDALFTSKFAEAPAIVRAPSGEPGLGGVRIAGVDGTIVTTDEHGRYHLPCAMLPADRGSNFILKLDTRSLPAGYRLTTENPRVVRLTPGKMTNINFGATLGRVVRVDLSEQAFTTDSKDRLTLAPELVAGIELLLPRIADEAVRLRLAFHLAADAGPEQVRAARERMRLVERHIARKWRETGQVKLTIEQTLVRAGE